MKLSTPEANKPVARTSAGLRDAMFDELDAIRNGKSNPTRANAIAKLAASVVDTVRMEVEVSRHLRNTNNADGNALFDAAGIVPSLTLGTAS